MKGLHRLLEIRTYLQRKKRKKKAHKTKKEVGGKRTFQCIKWTSHDKKSIAQGANTSGPAIEGDLKKTGPFWTLGAPFTLSMHGRHRKT